MRSLLLLVSLAVLGCDSAETGHSRIDPALARMIPPDAVMLAGVRMDQIRTTPLYQKLMAQKRLAQLDQFAEETGFDPRKDVRELLVASNGKDTVVMARGTFQIRGFEGVKQTSYRGYTLFAKEEAGVALIDGATAVAGKLGGVRAALDQYKSGNRNAPAVLLARVQEIPPQNQAWSVAQGFGSFLEGSIPQTGNAANFGKILRSLENTTGAADFRAGLNGFATGLCKTEQDAKNIGDAARGLVGLGRLSVPDNQPELLRLWDGIQVDQQQRTVKITVTIPQDLIDKLIQFLEMGPRRNRPAVIRPAAASWAAGSPRPGWMRRPR